MKTATERRDEFIALGAVIKEVPRTTYFGDDNEMAIQAQMDVIDNAYDEDDVEEFYGGDSDYVRDAALSAAAWLVGEYDSHSNDDGVLIDRPSREWQELAGTLEEG